MLQKSYDLLAQREYSRKGLRYRLERICSDGALLDKVLDELSEAGLQSDVRFTEGFVRQHVNRGQGPLKIQWKLQQHGITQALIAEFLNTELYDWHALAEQARVKKFGVASPADQRKKSQQYRFLHQRGFDTELIMQILV